MEKNNNKNNVQKGRIEFLAAGLEYITETYIDRMMHLTGCTGLSIRFAT